MSLLRTRPILLLTLGWATAAFSQTADSPTNRVEALKQFMTSPPIIQALVWHAENPGNHENRYSLLRWQPDALFYRETGNDLPALASTKVESAYNFHVFGRHNTNYWHLQGCAMRKPAKPLPPDGISMTRWTDPGNLPRDYSIGVYNMFRDAINASSPVLNMGVFGTAPGGLSWTGNNLAGYDLLGRTISGTMTVANDVPLALNYRCVGPNPVQPTTVVTNQFTVDYYYSPTNTTGLPDVLDWSITRGTRKFNYQTLEILTLITTNAPLPAASFEPTAFITNNPTAFFIERGWSDIVEVDADPGPYPKVE